MVTSNDLKLLTVKELAEIARQWGVLGWHDMRKDDLVRTLVARSRSKTAQNSQMPPDKVFKRLQSFKAHASKSVASKGQGLKSGGRAVGSSAVKTASNGKSQKTGPAGTETAHQTESVVGSRMSTKKRTSLPRMEAARRPDGLKHPPHADVGGGTPSKRRRSDQPGQNIQQFKENLARHRQIRTVEEKPGHEDRLVLMVRDPYWIHAFWAIGPRAIERAKVALGHHWHGAKPVLRLYRIISDGATNPRRQLLREIMIHGGVDNWYIEVSDPPTQFQVELGYTYHEKRFHSLAVSNAVLTPQNRVKDDVESIDGNWSGVAADFDRVFKLSGGLDSHNNALKAVFEEKLKRPMSAPLISRFGPRPLGSEKTKRNFEFQIEADIVLFGQTDPSVQISIKDEPIRLNPDGSFSVRFSLPEKRHVFPVDAVGSDGVETQRVIIALERNTKILETLIVEHEEEE
ncbi:MAG TPA: hypothetical protein DEB39_05425 [Planctomycetaceae bacterium]|nr:hypothetical protein [Planctomycetaceae bacterium]